MNWYRKAMDDEDDEDLLGNALMDAGVVKAPEPAKSPPAHQVGGGGTSPFVDSLLNLPMASAGNAQSPIYFHAVPITQENYEELAGGYQDLIGHFTIWVEPRDHWLAEHCHADTTPDWMMDILQSLEFGGEDLTNVWTIPIDIMENVQDDLRFYASPEFAQFMMAHLGEQ